MDHQSIEDAAVDLPWSATRRAGVSLLIALHVTAIFVAPLAAVEPRSQLSIALRRVFEPYLQMMYLDHGYRFFAPEPGPSHIVEFEITDEDGNSSKGHFPDRDNLWPRLRYHRWFMLSETINQHAILKLDEQQMLRWRTDVDRQAKNYEREFNIRRANQVRAEFEQQLQGYNNVVAMLKHLSNDVGRVLLEKNAGRVIRMSLVTRLIPTPYDVQDGYPLNDESYVPAELKVDLGVVGQGREELPRGEGDSN